MKEISIKIQENDKISDIYRKYRKVNNIYKNINQIFPANNADLEIDLLRGKIKITSTGNYFNCNNNC